MTKSVSRVLLEELKSLGFDHIFMNSGTDYAPIIEGMAEMALENASRPEIILVPHEGPTVGMAIGYYMVSHRPGAVMVHTTPGTANSLTNVLNARAMNIPLLLFAGRTPVTENGIFGGKEIPVHWNQELRDQGEILRQFTKWDWEHRYGEQTGEELARAYEMAMSDPRGPVYMTLPRERIAEPAPSQVRARKPSTTEPAAPSPEVAGRIAELLLQAKNPLIITSQLASNDRAPMELLRLAGKLAIPVSQNFYYMNFPTTSELFIGGIGSKLYRDYMKKADLILMIDVDVPWFPGSVEPDGGASVIHIDSDPMKERMPTWGFGSDIRVLADSATALKMINLEIEGRIGELAGVAEALETRRSAVSQDHEKMMASNMQEAQDHRDDTPIDPRWLSYCIGKAISDNTIVFTETVRSPFYEYAPISGSGRSFSLPPFGGLGWAMGAALGAKLASPGSDVMALMGDGAYMYNAPVACHYVSRARNLPILSIIYNNQAWLASRGPVAKLYPEGNAVRSSNFPGTDLNPSPDFEHVARSSGALARKVDDPHEISNALQESLDHMHEKGSQAFLNVILKHH